MEAPNASERSSPSKGSSLSERSSPSTPAIFQVRQIRPVRFPPVGALLLVALLFAISGCASAQPTPQAAPTSPSPKLSPAEVVSAQLAALKNNDADDMGIRITFRFASPGNQAQTGPVDRFIAMLKNPAYRPMINYQSDHREPIEVDGNVAKQIVTLVSSSGRSTRYVFVLSKQEQPPCKGCWMTDAVMRLDPKSGPVRVASARF